MAVTTALAVQYSKYWLKGSIYLNLLNLLFMAQADASQVEQSHYSLISRNVVEVCEAVNETSLPQHLLSLVMSRASAQVLQYQLERLANEQVMLAEQLKEAHRKPNVRLVAIQPLATKKPCKHYTVDAEVSPGSPYSVDLQTQLQPLTITAATSQPSYAPGDKMVLYFSANRAFYGRVIYRDVQGNMLQILPNRARTSDYFAAQSTYHIPASSDRFSFQVVPPAGYEQIIIYASTQPLGVVEGRDAGPFHLVEDDKDTLGLKVRGLKLKKTQELSASQVTASVVAEFSETTLSVTIRE